MHTHACMYIIVFEWVTCPLWRSVVDVRCLPLLLSSFWRLVVLARLPGFNPHSLAPTTLHSCSVKRSFHMDAGSWTQTFCFSSFAFPLSHLPSPLTLNLSDSSPSVYRAYNPFRGQSVGSIGETGHRLSNCVTLEVICHLPLVFPLQHRDKVVLSSTEKWKHLAEYPEQKTHSINICVTGY